MVNNFIFQLGLNEEYLEIVLTLKLRENMDCLLLFYNSTSANQKCFGVDVCTDCAMARLYL